MPLRLPLLSGLLVLLSAALSALAGLSPERIATLRLQIFLEERNFSPGLIDGRPGYFTDLAATTYLRSQNHDPTEIGALRDEARFEVEEWLIEVSIPANARRFVSRSLPHSRSAQARRGSMPYRSYGEYLAERYHTSVSFLREINGSSRVGSAKIGSRLLVPAVTPFRIEELVNSRRYAPHWLYSRHRLTIDTRAKQLRIYGIKPTIAEFAWASIGKTPPAAPPKALIVRSGRAREIAEVDVELLAAFPITTGRSGVIRYGLWEVRNSVELPSWRYDPKLLSSGKRGSWSLDIPGGPNNPVGVVWTGLSKRGIGIHGTDKPETIGKAKSSGCIRLHNWNAAKMPDLIRPGAKAWIK